MEGKSFQKDQFGQYKFFAFISIFSNICSSGTFIFSPFPKMLDPCRVLTVYI